MTRRLNNHSLLYHNHEGHGHDDDYDDNHDDDHDDGDDNPSYHNILMS